MVVMMMKMRNRPINDPDAQPAIEHDEATMAMLNRWAWWMNHDYVPGGGHLAECLELCVYAAALGYQAAETGGSSMTGDYLIDSRAPVGCQCFDATNEFMHRLHITGYDEARHIEGTLEAAAMAGYDLAQRHAAAGVAR